MARSHPDITFQQLFNNITPDFDKTKVLFDHLKNNYGFSYRVNDMIDTPWIALQSLHKIDRFKNKGAFCKRFNKEIQKWIQYFDHTKIAFGISKGEQSSFEVWLKKFLPKRAFIINMFNSPVNPFKK